MEPNNPQYSIDYLNSISSTPAPKTIKPLYLWVLIVGVIVLVAVVVMLVLSSGNGTKDNLMTFAARLSMLETVSTDAKDNIQSSDLRTTNSSLTLILTNANRDVLPLSGKINKKSSAAKTVAAETTMLTTALENARLNAVYDRTYAREMSYQLKDIRTQMSILYKNTNKTALKTYLEKTDESIKPIQESLASFNEG
jgi:hypothetical protein